MFILAWIADCQGRTVGHALLLQQVVSVKIINSLQGPSAKKISQLILLQGEEDVMR
jgi:hypothetical protein